MCDPITMAIAAASSALGLGAAGVTAPNPPEAKMPAVASPTSRAAGADIRLGDANKATTQTTSSEPRPFIARRARGNSLGNLGQSVLRI